MNAPVRIDVSTVSGLAGFTAREYIEMVGSGAFGDLRVELVGGELKKMMPSNFRHGERNVSLAVLLTQVYAEIGARLGSDVIVKVDDATVRAADIVVVRQEFESEGATTGRDLLLAIEVAVTTLPEDLGEKAVDYGRSGIPAYWVVDETGRAIHVMTGPSQSGYTDRQIVRFGEPLAVPGTDATITID